jgi:hypothetical protein
MNLTSLAEVFEVMNYVCQFSVTFWVAEVAEN